MKKEMVLPMILMICFALASASFGAEKAPQKVIDLANSKLIAIGNHPIIIAAVKAENAKQKTLDQIKALDQKWIKTAGIDDFMKAIMESECGRYLRQIQQSQPFYSEIFVMDNQGANVAMTDKTSDYWQGDEAKFIKSYNQGNGEIFISDVKFDDSSQAYLVQVSVPVKDGDLTIGVITIGVDVDKID